MKKKEKKKGNSNIKVRKQAHIYCVPLPLVCFIQSPLLSLFVDFLLIYKISISYITTILQV